MCAGYQFQSGGISAGVGRCIEAGENIWQSETDRNWSYFYTLNYNNEGSEVYENELCSTDN